MEKNSAAPDVQIVGGQGLTGILVVPYVEFVLTEVLKNALQVRLAALCIEQWKDASDEICAACGQQQPSRKFA